jgi:GH15 family glucan-1,4-alpha-glucosidase
LKIADYALIGDCQTAALVGRNGSIDWLCLPRFDSGACFAALLGKPENGRWCIAPADREARASRRYRDDTLILETTFETSEGKATLIDFMPIRDHQSDVVRIVVGERGSLSMEMELIERFDYGSSVPWVSRLPDGSGLRAIVGPDMTVLRTPVETHGKDLTTVAEFTVREGERIPFVLTHVASHLEPPPPIDPEAKLAETERFWTEWSSRCASGEDVQDGMLRRSLITLKALTYSPTGGIVAAPTTSLPEWPGGTRNWDYRFCWVRDATFTLLGLMSAGYQDEACAWREWLLRAIAGNPDQIQIMYGIAGERRLTEWEIGWLSGHEGAAPVRVGNAAANQFQLDVYGEVMDVFHQARAGGLPELEASWQLQCALLRHLETCWQDPDQGIWEVRGGARHFTYSKMMAWVAFDRAIKDAERFELRGPIAQWRELRDRIHDDVCRKGFDERRGTFVQSYGSDELDASLLLLPITGFLPPTDARVSATVSAIERELVHGGLVYRYRTREELDGLPPGEGAFLACTFWLADNYVLQERRPEALELYRRVAGLANDVGLLAEEYDPASDRFLGNFPQAFSHVALVNTALNLSARPKPAHARAKG